MIGQHRTERLWIPFGYRPRSMMMTINRQIDRVTNQNQRMTQFLLFNCRKISSDHQVKNVIFLKNKRFYQSQMSLISWISRPVSHIMTESKIETKKKRTFQSVSKWLFDSSTGSGKIRLFKFWVRIEKKSATRNNYQTNVRIKIRVFVSHR